MALLAPGVCDGRSCCVRVLYHEHEQDHLLHEPAAQQARQPVGRRVTRLANSRKPRAALARRLRTALDGRMNGRTLASSIWAVIVGAIVLLVIYGIVSTRVRDRRVRRLSRSLLPDIKDHIKADRLYRIALASGTILDKVRFLGISNSQDKAVPCLPFHLQHWLVLEKEDGKRLFLRPNAVKFYEEL